jgi:hypothetical protein
MDTWKEKNLLYSILGKIKSLVRPIVDNGSSVTSKEKEAAIALQTVLLDLKNIKLINKSEVIVPPK